jgi:hypothetical protein
MGSANEDSVNFTGSEKFRSVDKERNVREGGINLHILVTQRRKLATGQPDH